RRAQPAAAARALRAAVDQLGAFDANDRDEAGRALQQSGAAGIESLLTGLTDSRLAIRVGSNDTLMRILPSGGAAPAAIPRFDPWAPAAERTRMAAALRAWWKHRGTGSRASL